MKDACVGVNNYTKAPSIPARVLNHVGEFPKIYSASSFYDTKINKNISKD
jgi:hypothetical protein